MSNAFYGLTSLNTDQLVFDIAELNKILSLGGFSVLDFKEVNINLKMID